MAASKKRLKLLLKLESIIGNECYNGRIQNWGPNRARYSDGREYRYPLTLIDSDGKKPKHKYTEDITSIKVAMTGHYAFGTNHLNIMEALNKVIDYLEADHGLKI